MKTNSEITISLSGNQYTVTEAETGKSVRLMNSIELLNFMLEHFDDINPQVKHTPLADSTCRRFHGEHPNRNHALGIA